MPSPVAFRLITGVFVIIGYQPDGDSVRFIADNPALFQDLYRGNMIRLSKKDQSVQLRFDGIDAPEVHYGSAEQPLGDKARDILLKKMGFTNIQYSGKTAKSASPQAGVRGAILVNSADPHGRPISYVLPASVAPDFGPDGTDLIVKPQDLSKTMNYFMLEEGMAFGLFYTSAPEDHRNYFRAIAEAARKAKKGVWSEDSSEDFVIDGQTSLGPEGTLIYPKLFRRATDYLKDVAKGVFSGDLAEWIKAKSTSEDDEVWIGKVKVHFSELVTQSNKHTHLQGDVLGMVFVER
jgi:endonuclease YncB( thermonuclease family)